MIIKINSQCEQNRKHNRNNLCSSGIYSLVGEQKHIHVLVQYSINSESLREAVRKHYG